MQPHQRICWKTGGGGSQGVWDGEERLGEWKEGKELGHHCGRRAGVGRERGHQQRGSGILDPTPSGLAVRPDSHDR